MPPNPRGVRRKQPPKKRTKKRKKKSPGIRTFPDFNRIVNKKKVQLEIVLFSNAEIKKDEINPPVIFRYFRLKQFLEILEAEGLFKRGKLSQKLYKKFEGNIANLEDQLDNVRSHQGLDHEELWKLYSEAANNSPILEAKIRNIGRRHS